jgi:hypothetical protein
MGADPVKIHRGDAEKTKKQLAANLRECTRIGICELRGIRGFFVEARDLALSTYSLNLFPNSCSFAQFAAQSFRIISGHLRRSAAKSA